MTRRCNLKCVHCYAQAEGERGSDPISTEQAKAMIDDLAAFGAPVMLFSGGEPLVRRDLPELASYATSRGMRAVISTNGTLIDRDMAKRLREVGLSYVGISLDGGEEIHDKFRGVPGSYRRALEGLEYCREEGSRSDCASPSTNATQRKSRKFSTYCARGIFPVSVFIILSTPAAEPSW